MSERQRREARKNATEKGAQAFRDGKPVESNPYADLGLIPFTHATQKGSWSLRPFWNMGWRDAEREHKNQATHD